MEYILFIHKNTDFSAAESEWARFIDLARNSGMFLGGSEIGKRVQIGDKAISDVTESIGGYMRFQSNSFTKLNQLLSKHPVLNYGGSLELCELPKS